MFLPRDWLRVAEFQTKEKALCFRRGLRLYLMPGSLRPTSLWAALRVSRSRHSKLFRTILSYRRVAYRQTANKRKSPVLAYRAFLLFDAWQFPTLAWGDPTLPSALRRFTSEFGMGSGGTTALLPPGKFCFIPTATLAAIETNLGTR